MANPYCIARLTGVGAADPHDITAALRVLLGGQVGIEALPASSDDEAIRACGLVTPETIIVRTVEGGPSYLGCAIAAERGDARTLVDLLRRAITGSDAEPLPDEVLERWRAAVRADPPTAGTRYWQRLASMVADGSPNGTTTPREPSYRARRELPADVAARLEERFLAGAEAGVLVYAAACWLVTSERVTDEAVQSLSLMVDRRSRPELARVAGRTHHWLPVVERLDPRTRFPALERAVASAREIGQRWQEQIPDDFPPVATGVDVHAPDSITGVGIECEIADLGGWSAYASLTLRLIRADSRWWLDLASDGEPPEPWLAGWGHVLKIATEQPLCELALAPAEAEVNEPADAPDVVQAIEAWQTDRPGDIAIVDAHGQVTVDELWHAAGELSAAIRPGTAVGIHCARDRSFVVAVLATLRAGAYFIPHGGPADSVSAVVTGDRVETVDGIGQIEGEYAYGIRTSGSLGQPKLAMVSRRSLAAATQRVARFVEAGQTDRYLHLASFGFSSSIRQMFVPLTRRATVLMATEELRTDAAALLSWLADVRPTIIDTTPTTLHAIAEAGGAWPSSVRVVISASEQLTPSIVDLFRASTTYTGPLLHMYGMTETSGLVAGLGVGDETPFALATLPGCGLYIRDAYLHPLPVGIPGELYVDVGAGDDAYSGATATAVAFVPSPRTSAARMVRTRDRARLRVDGTVEWLGRYDDLVKIRAERVSLTDIAEIAQAHPAVARAYAIDAHGEIGIAVAVARGSQMSVDELAEYLRGQGLQAGLPTRVAIVDHLPQNASGKIDRQTVRELVARSGDQRAPVVAPSTPTEAMLFELWSALLPERTIGITDNFFDLGGHSLKAAQLAARVRRQLECGGVSVSTVFDHPTIRAMAAFVDASRTDA